MRLRFFILILSCVFAARLLAADPPPPVRIMPLGDSMTLGYSVPTYLSGYRDLLYALLHDAGYNVDFVGTLVDTQNSAIPDPDHEGHGGYRIDQINAGITGWLNSVQSPDIVLLLIGTNDFWQNYQTGTASDRLEALVARLLALRPSTTVLLATLAPRVDNAGLEAAQVAFNSTLPGIVNRQLVAGKRVYFVDVHRLLGASDLSSDGVHPNQTGYDKIAAAWLPSIDHALQSDINILANGSFENDATGWSPSGNVTVLAATPPYAATAGGKLAVFNGGQTAPNGVLTQSFSTIAGRTYVLEFDVGALGPTTSQQRLLVSLQGNTTLLSQVLALNGGGGSTTRWMTPTFTFAADSSTTILSFLDVSTTSNNIDLLLDHAQVRPRMPRTLTIVSAPAAGASIAVEPADNDGATSGVATFKRTYNDGIVASLTAPPTSGDRAFIKWQLDGDDFSTQARIDVAMDADHTASAVYGESAPVITGQSSSLTASVGSSVTFAVNATGSSLTYQWRLNDADIPGANERTYSIPSVQLSNGGRYTVVVSNASGSTTSAAAILTVIASGTLANPSFESDYAAWNATGNQIVVSDGSYETTAGSHLVVFNGGQATPNGVLTQRFTTIAGQSYILAFDMGVFGYSTAEQRLRVTVQGTGSLVSDTVSLTGLGGGRTQWTSASYTFVADSNTATITFQDVSPTSQNLDLLLDNVRLDQQVARTLTIDSSPDSGANIAVSPFDHNDAGNGVTPFTRVYTQGTTVTLIAPAGNGGLAFEKWQRDGVDFSTNASLSLTVDGDHALTAVYAPVAAFTNGSFEANYAGWTASGNLIIAADSSPTTDGSHVVVFNSGQSAPNGVLSQTFATTPGQSYTLVFDVGVYAYSTSEQRLHVVVQGNDTLVSQTASLSGLGSGRTRWTTARYSFVADSAATTLTFQDVSPTSQNLDLLLDNVRLDQPVPRTLTIDSSPNDAVAIAVSPADNDGASGGSTRFTRIYTQGASVTLTAPASAGALAFQKWQRDGSDFSTSATLTFTLDGDHTLTAVYAPVAAFTNGSFESDYAGWTASGNQIIAADNSSPTTDGSHVVVFNSGQSTPNGTLSQTFATTPGQSYTLAFDVGVFAGNTHEQRLAVTAQGTITLLSQTVSIFGLGGGQTRWMPVNYTFVADSAATTLTFQDVSPTSQNLDLLLDNVRLDQPVPRTLTVDSSPSGAVAIALSPADNNDAADGSTRFTRVYTQGTSVTLTAPASAGTLAFQKWQRDGADFGTAATLTFTVDGDHTLTAVYAPVTAFTNGSFESDYAGWTASGNQFIASDGSYKTTDGSHVLVFNGGQSTPNGTLSQTFATTPDQSYTLTFDVGVLAYNTKEQRLGITVHGSSPLLAQTISVFGAGGGATRWTPVSYTFVADGSAATIVLQDVSPVTENLDLLVDNIRLTP